MYPALHRLEDAGLLASSWAEADGRRRRVYGLTDKGGGPGRRADRVAQVRHRRSDGSGVVSVSDLIREYLNELRASLRLAPQETDVIVDEAEDHLRETTAAGLGRDDRTRGAAGGDPAFSSVAAVVRAHRERHEWNVALAGQPGDGGVEARLALPAAVGVSGVLDWIMDLSAGERFAGFAVGAPVGRLPAAECRKLLSEFVGAHSCAEAWTQDQTATTPASSRQPSCWRSFWSRATSSCATSGPPRSPGAGCAAPRLLPGGRGVLFRPLGRGPCHRAAQTAAAGGGPGALISGSITAACCGGGVCPEAAPRAAREREAADGPATGLGTRVRPRSGAVDGRLVPGRRLGAAAQAAQQVGADRVIQVIIAEIQVIHDGERRGRAIDLGDRDRPVQSSISASRCSTSLVPDWFLVTERCAYAASGRAVAGSGWRWRSR